MFSNWPLQPEPCHFKVLRAGHMSETNKRMCFVRLAPSQHDNINPSMARYTLHMPSQDVFACPQRKSSSCLFKYVVKLKSGHTIHWRAGRVNHSGGFTKAHVQSMLSQKRRQPTPAIWLQTRLRGLRTKILTYHLSPFGFF